MPDKERYSDGDKPPITKSDKPGRVYFIIGKGVSLEEAGAFVDALYHKHFGDS